MRGEGGQKRTIDTCFLAPSKRAPRTEVRWEFPDSTLDIRAIESVQKGKPKLQGKNLSFHFSFEWKLVGRSEDEEEGIDIKSTTALLAGWLAKQVPLLPPQKRFSS